MLISINTPTHCNIVDLLLIFILILYLLVYLFFTLYLLLDIIKNKAVKYFLFLAFFGSTEVGTIMAAESISDPSTLFLEAFLYLPTIKADKGNPVSSCSHRKKAIIAQLVPFLIIDLPCVGGF